MGVIESKAQFMEVCEKQNGEGEAPQALQLPQQEQCRTPWGRWEGTSFKHLIHSQPIKNIGRHSVRMYNMELGWQLPSQVMVSKVT